jgi:hypothetical protein
MAHLACWSCGRQIYTVSPIDALAAEERRCPRCRTMLNLERRGQERRTANRRQYVPAVSPIREERLTERRETRRRQNPTDGSNRIYGWSAR